VTKTQVNRALTGLTRRLGTELTARNINRAGQPLKHRELREVLARTLGYENDHAMLADQGQKLSDLFSVLQPRSGQPELATGAADLQEQPVYGTLRPWTTHDADPQEDTEKFRTWVGGIIARRTRILGQRGEDGKIKMLIALNSLPNILSDPHLLDIFHRWQWINFAEDNQTVILSRAGAQMLSKDAIVQLRARLIILNDQVIFKLAGRRYSFDLKVTRHALQNTGPERRVILSTPDQGGTTLLTFLASDHRSDLTSDRLLLTDLKDAPGTSAPSDDLRGLQEQVGRVLRSDDLESTSPHSTDAIYLDTEASRFLLTHPDLLSSWLKGEQDLTLLINDPALFGHLDIATQDHFTFLEAQPNHYPGVRERQRQLPVGGTVDLALKRASQRVTMAGPHVTVLLDRTEQTDQAITSLPDRQMLGEAGTFGFDLFSTHGLDTEAAAEFLAELLEGLKPEPQFSKDEDIDQQLIAEYTKLLERMIQDEHDFNKNSQEKTKPRLLSLERAIETHGFFRERRSLLQRRLKPIFTGPPWSLTHDLHLSVARLRPEQQGLVTLAISMHLIAELIAHPEQRATLIIRQKLRADQEVMLQRWHAGVYPADRLLLTYNK